MALAPESCRATDGDMARQSMHSDDEMAFVMRGQEHKHSSVRCQAFQKCIRDVIRVYSYLALMV